MGLKFWGAVNTWHSTLWAIDASGCLWSNSCISTVTLTENHGFRFYKNTLVCELCLFCLTPWFPQFRAKSDFLPLLLSVPHLTSQLFRYLCTNFPELNSSAFLVGPWLIQFTCIPKHVYVGSWYIIHFILRVVVKTVGKPQSRKINLKACRG